MNDLTHTFTDSPLPHSGMIGHVYKHRQGLNKPVGTAHVCEHPDGSLEPLWEVGELDFEGQDIVLLYTHNSDLPFSITGDMLRVSRNRRWLFGASVGSPADLRSTYTFLVNPDTPIGWDIRPWRNGPYDVRLYKLGDRDCAWLRFSQGSEKHDIRIGMVGSGTSSDPYGIAVFAAQGQDSSPSSPGRRIAFLSEHGVLTVESVKHENA